MIALQTNRPLEFRLLATAVLFVGLPLFAAAASAQVPPASDYTDPAAIDEAVTAFTGVPIGEAGGARLPADRRLRLAACDAPLDVLGTIAAVQPFRSDAKAQAAGASSFPRSVSPVRVAGLPS